MKITEKELKEMGMSELKIENKTFTVFDSKESAENFREWFFDNYLSDVYFLRNGKPLAPSYEIKKIRGQEKYYIKQVFYFFEELFNALKKSPCNFNDCYADYYLYNISEDVE